MSVFNHASPGPPRWGDLVTLGEDTRLLVVDVLSPTLDGVGPGCVVVCAWRSPATGHTYERAFSAAALLVVRRAYGAPMP